MIPFLVGLAGISGAGKSTLVEHLENQGGIKRFRFDAFYKDEAEYAKDGERPNWDAPESIHLDRAFEALKELKNGNEIWLPIYNRRESRCVGKTIFKPEPIIFVEGLLLFSDERIRELFDLRLWLEVSEEEGLRRRLQRQPGYDPEYHWRVAAPSARKFVLPYRSTAHEIIDGSPNFPQVAAQADVILHKYLNL